MVAISSSTPTINPLFATASPSPSSSVGASAGSSADGALPSPADMASALQSSIDAAVQRLQTQQSGPAAADNVQQFEKTVDKSTVHTAGYGTDIGILVNNTSRLTVVSALQPNDPADFMKFRVTESGPVTIGKLGDDSARVQIMNTYGSVLADSDPTSGDSYDAYKQLQQGTFNMDPGNFVMRITRDSSGDPKATVNYALQLSQGGSYSQDYDTIAKAAQPSDNPFKPPASLSALEDMLSGGGGAVSALGGGGGQSVLGMLFNGSF